MSCDMHMTESLPVTEQVYHTPSHLDHWDTREERYLVGQLSHWSVIRSYSKTLLTSVSCTVVLYLASNIAPAVSRAFSSAQG